MVKLLQRPTGTSARQLVGRSHLRAWRYGIWSWLLALLPFVVVVIMLSTAGTLPAQAVAAFQSEPAGDACAPPAIQVRNAAVNVREGPDPNYPIILVLRNGEELPLVGRHHGFRWWAVELPDGVTGWVWESGVTVTGNIGSVPLMPAPPLNGVVPDTTEEWVPVVETICPDVTEPPAGQPVTGTVPLVATPTPEVTETTAAERESWTEPQNLSQSGGARNPALIVDAAQTMHVLWEDAFAGYTYTRRDNETWTAPVTLTVPFSETQPHLFADADGQIQALWIDDESVLWQSRATAASITELGAWQEPVTLAEGAVVLNTTVDGEGQIHLVYLRAEETAAQPAGIYYQRSADGGMSWSAAELLDASPYFRGIDAPDSNVQIVADSDAGRTHVYVAWDNRSRKRIFFMHSGDGGENWETSQELVSPESTSSIILPFGVRISAEGSMVLAVWQYGQPEAQCQRYAQFSTDSGQSWSEAERLVDLNPGFASCASDNRLYSRDGLFYLLTVLGNELFMQAWDGQQWSTLQRQAELSDFNDPDTLNTVTLGCHQAVLFDGPSMALLACGTGNTFADVWFATRSLGTVETWFPPPSVWSEPVAVDAGAMAYRSLNVLSDGEGVHALWSAQAADQEDGWTIYYSRLEAGRWLPPARLFAGEGEADGTLAATVSADDRLIAVWRDSEGVLLFSEAAAADAAGATDWAPAQPLPGPPNQAGGVALASASNGSLYVAYSIPVNEGRGLYVLRSDDRGRSWSEPALVLDAEASGWEVVGAPQLAITGDGSLHLLIPQEKLGPAATVDAESLYYVRCTAAADACSEPSVVGQGQPIWNAIVSSGAETAHRLWQEQDGNGLRLRHQVSVDGGENWGEASLVTTLSPDGPAPATVSADPAGGLHLLLGEGARANAWSWDGSWTPEEPIVATVESLLKATVTDTGAITVLFSREGQPDDAADIGPQRELAAVSRQVELGEIAVQPVPAPVAAQPTPTATPEATPTPLAEAVVVPTLAGSDASANAEEAAGPAADNPITGIGLGIVPAALLVVGVLAYGARSMWLRRH